MRKPRTAGGTWSYRIDLGIDAEGRRSQKQVGGFRSKKEAQAALNDALSGIQHGTYIAPSRLTLGAFLDMWIEGVRIELALTAWTSYADIIRRWIKQHIGGKRLVELTPMDVKTWHGTLLDHGGLNGRQLSPRSVQFAHRVLHRALADAVRWNLAASEEPISNDWPPSSNAPSMSDPDAQNPDVRRPAVAPVESVNARHVS